MDGINLLPWREARRRARDRQIVTAAFLIWALCGVAVFGSYSYLKLLQDNQKGRNNYLTGEIKKLDEKIKEIRTLQKQKDNLIARMEVIQNLQQQRNQVVQIFEDIVRKLPDGVYFDRLNKKGRQFNFTGTAQSNARVSNLMENLGSSSWFNDPNLNVINVSPSEGVRISQFSLGVTQRKKPKAAKPAAQAQADGESGASTNNQEQG